MQSGSSEESPIADASNKSTAFPRQIADNCVEYAVYLVASPPAGTSVRDRLQAIRRTSQTLIKRYLKDYVWQQQGFDLTITQANVSWHLAGRTAYGDAVEDEWLIVWLLRALSKECPDAWIRVLDSDGDFLLIEAANALPKWLNPDNASVRIWINRGELLIIPPAKSRTNPQSSFSGQQELSLQDALQCLVMRDNLLHIRLVEEEAFFRLRNYPDQIRANLHDALLVLPRRAAHVLHASASYVGPAVEAFYLRDPIALRAFKRHRSGLAFPPDDLVTVRVRFNKVGFAQLKSQRFVPPDVWSDVMRGIDATRRARIEIGMKLTSGLEMLLADPQNEDRPVVREIKMILDDVAAGEEQLPADEDIERWGTTGDDESWLDIRFEDLDRTLGGKTTASSKSAGFGDVAAQENLQKMVQRFEDFLNDDDAGLSGADDDDEDEDENDEDMDDDDDNSGSDLDHDVTKDTVDSDSEDKEASFDEDEFTAMMREMMGMPKETMRELMGASRSTGTAPRDNPIAKAKSAKGADATGDVDDDAELAEIQQLSAAMEAELKRAGVLGLNADTAESQSTTVTDGASKGKSSGSHTDAVSPIRLEGHEEDDSVDQVQLARNLLESLKSQAGMAGPASNMLGMFGMKFPRDEDDAQD